MSKRLVMVKGLLPPTEAERVGLGHPATWPKNCLACFFGYAYADLPVGKTFEVAFRPGHPAQHFAAPCSILVVTQQFSMRWEHVPHGWKTIVLLRFSDGVPDDFLKVPQTTGWDRVTHLLLSSNDTLRAVLDAV